MFPGIEFNFGHVPAGDFILPQNVIQQSGTLAAISLSF